MNLIILLGFPKSGTTSLGLFFKHLGYNVIGHTTKTNRFVGMKIKDNYINGRVLLDGIVDPQQKNILTQLDCCYSNDIVSWPQIELYEHIYNQNKNALFILNKRNPNSILKSFKNQNHMDKRFLDFFLKIDYNSANCDVTQNDGLIIEFIKTHYNIIETFFKNKNNFVSFFLESFDNNYFNNFMYIPNNLQLPISNTNIIINTNNTQEILTHNTNIQKHIFERFPYSLFDIDKFYNIKLNNYVNHYETCWFKNVEQFTLYCLNKSIIIYTFKGLIAGFILFKKINEINKIVLFGYNETEQDNETITLFKNIILTEIIRLLNKENYIFEASNRISWFLRKHNINIITNKQTIENFLELKKNEEIIINNNFIETEPLSYHYVHKYINNKYENKVILFGNI